MGTVNSLHDNLLFDKFMYTLYKGSERSDFAQIWWYCIGIEMPEYVFIEHMYNKCIEVTYMVAFNGNAWIIGLSIYFLK